MSKPLNEWSYDELAMSAASGQMGGGANIEAMRRLREALDTHSTRLFWATIAILILTGVVAVLTFALVYHDFFANTR